MKKIIGYLRKHIREDFNPKFYALIFFFLLITFILNYKSDFNYSLLNASDKELIKFLRYFLFYCFPYYFTAVSYAFIYKKYEYLRSYKFWSVSLFALILLALNRSSFLIAAEVLKIFKYPHSLNYFFKSCLLFFSRFLTIVFPLYLYKLWFDKKQSGFYGLTRQNFDFRPYFLMLLIMLIPIIIASFQPSFLKTYPRYRPGAAEKYLQISVFATMFLFQIFYALRFVSVELFFRGFLIMAMPKSMARAVVMPMVVLYALWHFGKPAGEAIGAIFGSYILGVIALESRSILGGILIHIGIALLMEWSAFFQLYQL